MIEIKELRALRGPNRYSRHTVVFMPLDIKAYEDRPSDLIEGFSERLVALIPTLHQHSCSIGKPGGFIERLHTGTWAGHIIEHIAIELQCLAGMDVRYGKTFTTLETGIYIVVFRYLVESVGLKAATDAVLLFEAVVEGKFFDVNKVISELKVLRENDMLGPSTLSIVEEAKSRGIPVCRLNDENYIQLGYGAYQKRIQATMTCQTSYIAVSVADEKTKTKEHLDKAGIPVPWGRVVSTEQEAIAVFEEIGSSVVVKPDEGNHGKGSTINVTDLKQLKSAFQAAKARHPYVIVEEYVRGFDFRFLVINGILVAAAKREPAHVIGDGNTTIRQLIQKINDEPCRGFGHEKSLTKIHIDNMTERLLSLRGLSLDSCPAKGDKVYLKSTANLSQGGTATDVTDEVNPDIRFMIERASKIIGLNCAGIDALSKDISVPLIQSGIKVVEVNAAPGFRMHLEPTNGQSRAVAKPLINMLFPQGYVQVPVVAVTGTNGKTTTCKLIAHTLKYARKIVGLACTTGVEIDGNSILTGDYSGPEGAGVVLREPTVENIVLEVARGGLVRRGLGIDEVDVGVLLNIGRDHIGTDWIESQKDLSLIKSTVVEAVKKMGTSVLNADDEVTMSISDRAQGNIILFSLDSKNKYLINHVKSGGTVVTLNKQKVIIRNSDSDCFVCTLEEIPITLGGVVVFNISNALAAIGALHGLDLPIQQIRNGLMTFYPSPKQNPGRMNLFDFKKYKVLIDYAHNVESTHEVACFLSKLTQGRKIALCHGTGSRTNEQLVEYGQALALVYDYILLTDFDPRSRPIGETVRLLYDGLMKANFKEEHIEVFLESEKAVDHLFSKVEIGDLLIIHPNKLEPLISQIKQRYSRANASKLQS